MAKRSVYEHLRYLVSHTYEVKQLFKKGKVNSRWKLWKLKIAFSVLPTNQNYKPLLKSPNLEIGILLKRGIWQWSFLQFCSVQEYHG